jgi:hypothetical protein
MTQEATYPVETFNRLTGEVERRTITPVPAPQRIQRAKPLTKGELIDMIAELRDEIGDQQDRFDNKDVIDKERTDKRQELSAKVAELTQQLRETQSELDLLNRAGSVHDGFIAFAKSAEVA